MSSILSDVAAFASVDDRQIVKLYQADPKPVYVSVLIFRYERLMYKIISQWHSINRNRIFMSESDLMDVRHYAYLALMLFMRNTRCPDTIKNVGSRIKAYIYYVLNMQYRHRRYESSVDGMTRSGHDDPGIMDEDEIFDKNANVHIYLMLKYNYTYYKLSMMLFGSKSRKAMLSKFFKFKKRVILEILAVKTKVKRK